MAALPLNAETLPHHSRRVPVPAYDRTALRSGVVHIGVGCFHRSHQAVYFDALAAAGLGDGWTITGVGLRRREVIDALDAQDGLYTVLTRGDGGDEARVVGAITRCLFAPSDRTAVLDALADARTRLVTLTVTAQGYTGAPGSRESAPGLIALALDRRRRAGLPPFTVLSCDNIPDNGVVARMAVVAAAATLDERLGAWVLRHGAFPNSMADRITPQTTDADRALLADEFGVRDRWPVVTEPFSQWVIEDDFCDGRPPLDVVGAEFVRDVRPYALAKTRLLNGSHSALGYVGTIAGCRTADEAMADPLLAAFVEELMDEEVAPLLPPSDVEVETYAESLRERFANAAIADPLERLCRNGSSKVPRHVLSSIREARVAGRSHSLLTLAVAAWCRYLRGMPGVVVDDPRGAELQALARRGVRELLADEATFGMLGRWPSFAAEVESDVRELDAFGVRAVLARRLRVRAAA